ncbi:hypothetical protein pb186bvf_007462 [Paramecium bursaria]
MEEQIIQAIENNIKQDQTISGVMLVDKHGFYIYQKNMDIRKSYLIKSIADAAAALKQDETPKIVIESAKSNIVIQNSEKFYLAIEQIV